jgi:hypothetical protein
MLLKPMSTRRRISVTVLAWILGAVALRSFVLLPELCDPPTRAELDATALGAANWASENLDENGRFLYRYDQIAQEDLGGYNLVRHVAMSNALYQMVLAGNEEFLEPADRSMEYLFTLLIDTPEGQTFAVPNGRARVGGTGLMALALMHRREATGDQRYDDLIVDLGGFIVGQQEQTGALLAYWDQNKQAPIPDQYGQFATGEAFWALVLLDRTFPGNGFSEPKWLAADYVATARDVAEGYQWRQPDHWAAYAFADLALDEELKDTYVAYLRDQAGDFGLMTRYESQRTNGDWNQLVRGHQALGAGVGAMGEGLNGLLRVSLRDERLADLSAPLERHLACTTDLLVQRQSTSDDPAARGAWFSDAVTQVDDQQHTLSALLLYSELLMEGEAR